MQGDGQSQPFVLASVQCEPSYTALECMLQVASELGGP